MVASAVISRRTLLVCASGVVRRTTSARQRRQFDRGRHQLELAAVGARQRQQVLREPLDAGDFGAHVVEQFTIALERLGPILIEQVGCRPQDGQRRAQLVRGVGHELLLSLERLLDGHQRSTGQEPGATEHQQQTQAAASYQHQDQKMERSLLRCQALTDDQQVSIRSPEHQHSGWLVVQVDGGQRGRPIGRPLARSLQ